MNSRIQLISNVEGRSSKNRFLPRVQVVSPIDGRIYVERDYAQPGQIQGALELATLAQQEWRHTPLGERARLCANLVEALMSMAGEIVEELAWQIGRPVRQGMQELRDFSERSRFMISLARDALVQVEPVPLEGIRRYIRREPVGTVLIVAPWNYPFLTVGNALIPALMAGNSVILKHSSLSPLVGERLAAAATHAGLPPGVFQNLLMDHDSVASVLRSGRVQHVNFTGSVSGGRTIAACAAEQFLGLGLGLGGKNPAYVRADADLELSVSHLVAGSFVNSGQNCAGVERIYVHDSIYQAFIERFEALSHALVLGNPLETQTTLGPMVSTRAAEFVRSEIAQAVSMGARPLIDPSRFPADRPGSCYLAPQALVQVNHRMSLMREENFGPVVGIMAVRDDQRAVSLMNDSSYGLAASIWTRNMVAAEAIGDQLAVGTVYMNRCDYLDPALAWSGVKAAGQGASLSRIGYESLTRPKSYHLRHRL